MSGSPPSYARAYYRTNKKMNAQCTAARRRRAKINAVFVCEYLSDHPCVDCKEDDIVVLEFDHVRGQKKRDVSTLVTWGAKLEIVKAEILKCDVRCANCHKRKTKREQRSYSWRYAQILKRKKQNGSRSSAQFTGR